MKSWVSVSDSGARIIQRPLLVHKGKLVNILWVSIGLKSTKVFFIFVPDAPRPPGVTRSQLGQEQSTNSSELMLANAIDIVIRVTDERMKPQTTWNYKEQEQSIISSQLGLLMLFIMLSELTMSV